MHWYSKQKKDSTALVVVASKSTPIRKNVKNTPRAVMTSEGPKLQDVMKDVIRLSPAKRNILRQYLNASSE